MTELQEPHCMFECLNFNNASLLDKYPPLYTPSSNNKCHVEYIHTS